MLSSAPSCCMKPMKSACSHISAIIPSTILTIPITPNSTSGFLVLVAPQEVVQVDYGVEDAFKFIVSSGTVGKNFALPQAESSESQLGQ